MDVNPAQAQAYIINPLTGRKANFASLFSTHPPTADRIARCAATSTDAAYASAAVGGGRGPSRCRRRSSLSPCPISTATGAAGTASVPLPPAAYLQPGNYANTPLVSFTARDASRCTPTRSKQGCTLCREVDAVLATGKSNGNGVLLGTANGATVVAEDVWEFAKLAEVAKLINEARSSPECVAYAAADPFNRIYAQYPQVPPLPTLGPTVEKNDYAAFAGTTMSSPQASGAAALIRSGKRVAWFVLRHREPDTGSGRAAP